MIIALGLCVKRLDFLPQRLEWLTLRDALDGVHSHKHKNRFETIWDKSNPHQIFRATHTKYLM